MHFTIEETLTQRCCGLVKVTEIMNCAAVTYASNLMQLYIVSSTLFHSNITDVESDYRLS